MTPSQCFLLSSHFFAITHVAKLGQFVACSVTSESQTFYERVSPCKGRGVFGHSNAEIAVALSGGGRGRYTPVSITPRLSKPVTSLQSLLGYTPHYCSVVEGYFGLGCATPLPCGLTVNNRLLGHVRTLPSRPFSEQNLQYRVCYNVHMLSLLQEGRSLHVDDFTRLSNLLQDDSSNHR